VVRQHCADLCLVLGILEDNQQRVERMKTLVLNELREFSPQLERAIALLAGERDEERGA
jgi:hypothetical protein